MQSGKHDGLGGGGCAENNFQNVGTLKNIFSHSIFTTFFDEVKYQIDSCCKRSFRHFNKSVMFLINFISSANST